MSVLSLLVMPLRRVPLLTICALSVALAFAFKAWVFGLPLILMLSSWLLKYSFVFLDELVAGATAPPVLSVEMIVGSLGEWRSLMPLIIVTIAFFASGAGSFWMAPALSAVLVVAAVAFLPAILAVQGWTGSVGQSLNPRVCARMVRILGRDYAWVAALTFLLVALCVAAQWEGRSVPLALRIASVVYAWLAIIALVGGVVHTRRPDIERETLFFTKLQPVMTPEELARLREHCLDTIYGEWRGRAPENAWRNLVEYVEQSADPLEEMRWLYGRIAGWDRPQLANRIARVMVPRLLTAERQGEALALVRERLAADPDFRPHTSAELLTLAQLARVAADRRTARALLQEFPRWYRNDSLQSRVDELARDLER